MQTKSPTAEERFDTYLRQHHRRRTDERMTILREALKLSGHFTAEDFHAHLTAQGYPVAIATVYATLDLLTDCGILLKQRFTEKASCYEIASAGTTVPHHHLICSICGKIKEVRDPAVSQLVNSRRYAGFSPQSYSLTIYGVCTSCSRKTNRKKTKSAN